MRLALLLFLLIPVCSLADHCSCMESEYDGVFEDWPTTFWNNTFSIMLLRRLLRRCRRKVDRHDHVH